MSDNLTPETKHRHFWETKSWKRDGVITHTNIWCRDCHDIYQWIEVARDLNQLAAERRKVEALEKALAHNIRQRVTRRFPAGIHDSR